MARNVEPARPTGVLGGAPGGSGAVVARGRADVAAPPPEPALARPPLDVGRGEEPVCGVCGQEMRDRPGLAAHLARDHPEVGGPAP